MFCYQCEQTVGGTGCTKFGTCGKSPELAALQDLLVHTLKGLSEVAVEAKRIGISNPEMDRFTCKAIFNTLTNVNFDTERFPQLINKAVEYRDTLKEKVKASGASPSYTEAAEFKPAESLTEMVKQGAEYGIMTEPSLNPDIRSLQEIIVYALKGVAAYADHA
ncbi:MAG: hydroxylamine reductase, partial [Candidatus Bathyarchaeota archaeon]|nr:hydroxylamine reductase [Candidatus Bathyarchaeota archaeon]